MTRERYESISLHDLREIAKTRGMRRISTLKKADLIDALLKKDEEDAVILRNERMQRKQMQEASQGTGKEEKAGRSRAAEPESAEENPSMASAEETRPSGERQEKKASAAEGSQTRTRNQGSQRGHQGSGTINTNTGSQGSQTGRRQGTRSRRDDRQDRQGTQNSGRQNRQARQSMQAGYGAGQERNRQAESDRSSTGSEQTERNRASEQAQDRMRMSNLQSQDRGTGRSQNRDMWKDSKEAVSTPESEIGSYAAFSPDSAAMTAREQTAVYQNTQTAGQGSGMQTALQNGQQESPGTRLSRYYQPGRPDTPVLHKDELNAELDSGQMANGILEVMQDGFGFIRCANYMPGENDIYVAPSQIRRFGLKTGDIIVGNIRVRTQGEKFSALLYVKSVNGLSPDEATKRYNFEDMTPIFPDERIRLERSGGPVSMRIMDLISPVGKGQRGMIVSPPKAGKTTLIKEIARSVKYNNPEIHLIVLLIDERPEEVTDIREAIEGPNAEVIYSTFDELPEHHKRVSEMVIERARRLVEHKKDVMILLDSITRLTRAYNITEPSSGRTLSGGLDPAALHMPKRFFGAARNMREGGSLTILATALIDTGSKMDDIVFEEFKGTGNMELVLDRRLSERRIFPAIDIVRSGTRRDDLLLTPDEQSAMSIVRRSFNGLSAEQAVTQALDLFSRTRTNGEFVNMVRKVQWGSAPAMHNQ